MADTEVAAGVKKSTDVPGQLGFSMGYLLSPAGLIRILNIILGIISLGLWIPGYEDEFLGDTFNLQTGDTSKGRGNGWKRETLNQFVLSAIIICLFCSIILNMGLIFVQHASVDWHRCNKMTHLFLGVFLLIAFICSIFGTWYFQENCCHVDMQFSGFGVRFRVFGNTAEGYAKHCYCYLTRYLGQSTSEDIIDTVLYDPNRNPVDLTQFNENWMFAAHNLYPHVAAIFVILLNALLYLAGFFVSKPIKTH